MKIAVLGTGKFAIAIGYLLEINNVNFTFLGRDQNQLNELEKNGTNKKYSEYQFKNMVNVDLISNNLKNYDLIFYCLPSTKLNLVENLNEIPIIFTCKGFHENFIFTKFSNYCILSGGSYANEILNGIPCYITLSSKNGILNSKIKNLLQSNNCIISINHNPESIELLGIFKNILAIFCGIINELNMGKNIEAAFISKILKELKFFKINNHLIQFDEKTLIEPAGIGDLFLSCSSTKSRNYSFGISLIVNKTDKFKKLVEGYTSLCNMHKIIKNNLINDLMSVINIIKIQKENDKIKNKILDIIYKY